MIGIRYFGATLLTLGISPQTFGGLKANASDALPERYLPLLNYIPAEILRSKAEDAEHTTTTIKVEIPGLSAMHKQLGRLFLAERDKDSTGSILSEKTNTLDRSLTTVQQNLIQHQDRTFVSNSEHHKSSGFLTSISNLKFKEIFVGTKGDDKGATEITSRNFDTQKLASGNVQWFNSFSDFRINEQLSTNKSNDTFMSTEFNKKVILASVSNAANKNKVVNITQNIGDIILQPSSIEMSVEKMKLHLQDALKQVRDSMYY